MRSESVQVSSPEAMHRLGKEWASRLKPGDILLLDGPLGAGKTTLVRGILDGLGWHGAVRSPTFNLIQTFPARIPVMHADLYRLESANGLGLGDYFEDHLCLIEWPDRLGELTPDEAWMVRISFENEGRLVIVEPVGSH